MIPRGPESISYSLIFLVRHDILSHRVHVNKQSTLVTSKLTHNDEPEQIPISMQYSAPNLLCKTLHVWCRFLNVWLITAMNSAGFDSLRKEENVLFLC